MVPPTGPPWKKKYHHEWPLTFGAPHPRLAPRKATFGVRISSYRIRIERCDFPACPIYGRQPSELWTSDPATLAKAVAATPAKHIRSRGTSLEANLAKATDINLSSG